MRGHAVWPAASRANHADQMANHGQLQEWLGQQLSLAFKDFAPGWPRSGWRRGVTHHVSVPDPAVMRHQVAQIAQRAYPTGEHLPVNDAVTGGNSLLVGYFHHRQQLRNRTEVPHLDSHPERHIGAMFLPVVLDEIFPRTLHQTLVFLLPHRNCRYARTRIAPIAKLRMQSARAGGRRCRSYPADRPLPPAATPRCVPVRRPAARADCGRTGIYRRQSENVVSGMKSSVRTERITPVAASCSCRNTRNGYQ